MEGFKGLNINLCVPLRSPRFILNRKGRGETLSIFCKHSQDSGLYNKQTNDWLLIAEKGYFSGPDNIEQLFCHFEELAQEMVVTFDGWETRIDLE